MGKRIAWKRRCPIVARPWLSLPARSGRRRSRSRWTPSLRRARVAAPSVVWAPDGKRFAYVEQNRIWQYDVPSGKRRELITLSTLQTKAIVPPPAETTDWQNRRVAEQSIQWSSSGKDLLVLEGGDLFLLHTDTGRLEPAHRHQPNPSAIRSFRPMAGPFRFAGATISTAWISTQRRCGA